MRELPGWFSTTRVALIAALVAALSLLWLAGEAHYRGCVAQAEARFPAIAVSAFTTRNTGPLKVAYNRERAVEVQGCHRHPF